jgi:hypothetical protein
MAHFRNQPAKMKGEFKSALTSDSKLERSFISMESIFNEKRIDGQQEALAVINN